MGATAAVSGVLGAASIVGGQKDAKTQRRAQEQQNAIQANATRMSLLAQRQSVIDQAALQSAQLDTQKLFADQQRKLAQLDIQAQEQAQIANLNVAKMQTEMALNEQRFNNETALATARVDETNAKGEALGQRYGAQEQALQANTAAGKQVAGVADAASQATLLAGQQVGKTAFDIDASLVNQAAGGFNSSALEAQRLAAANNAVSQYGDATKQNNQNVDNAEEQQEYIQQVSSILKNMGIAEADATEAAGIAQAALAKAGYDINNINLQAMLGIANAQDSIDRKALATNSTSARNALELDKASQQFGYDFGKTSNTEQTLTSLKTIEAQARGASVVNPSKPSLLSGVAAIGSAGYGIYKGLQPTSGIISDQELKRQQMLASLRNYRDGVKL